MSEHIRKYISWRLSLIVKSCVCTDTNVYCMYMRVHVHKHTQNQDQGIMDRGVFTHILFQVDAWSFHGDTQYSYILSSRSTYIHT